MSHNFVFDKPCSCLINGMINSGKTTLVNNLIKKIQSSNTLSHAHVFSQNVTNYSTNKFTNPATYYTHFDINKLQNLSQVEYDEPILIILDNCISLYELCTKNVLMSNTFYELIINGKNKKTT